MIYCKHLELAILGQGVMLLWEEHGIWSAVWDTSAAGTLAAEMPRAFPAQSKLPGPMSEPVLVIQHSRAPCRCDVYSSPFA